MRFDPNGSTPGNDFITQTVSRFYIFAAFVVIQATPILLYTTDAHWLAWRLNINESESLRFFSISSKRHSWEACCIWPQEGVIS